MDFILLIFWVFLVLLLYEITLYTMCTIDIHKKGTTTLCFTLWEHFQNQVCVQLNCTPDLTPCFTWMHRQPLVTSWSAMSTYCAMSAYCDDRVPLHRLSPPLWLWSDLDPIEIWPFVIDQCPCFVRDCGSCLVDMMTLKKFDPCWPRRLLYYWDFWYEIKPFVAWKYFVCVCEGGSLQK